MAWWKRFLTPFTSGQAEFLIQHPQSPSSTPSAHRAGSDRRWSHGVFFGQACSLDASVTIPGWDRHGLERLVRYCARPPLSQERLGRVDDQMLVYSLGKATLDGRTELYLTPLELLDRLASSL